MVEFTYLLSIVLTFTKVWGGGGLEKYPWDLEKTVGPYAEIFFILNYHPQRLTQLFMYSE